MGFQMVSFGCFSVVFAVFFGVFFRHGNAGQKQGEKARVAKGRSV
jgi:hypothetical protein